MSADTQAGNRVILAKEELTLLRRQTGTSPPQDGATDSRKLITDGDAEMEMAVTDLAERSAADIPPRYSVPLSLAVPASSRFRNRGS